MKISRRSFVLGGAAALATAGVSPLLQGCVSGTRTKAGINPEDFETNGVGTLHLGLDDINSANVPTRLYTIDNSQGAQLCITNFGARVVSFMIRDRENKFKEVVLGFQDIREYADYNYFEYNFFGGVVGRYASRIANGKFSLDDKEYQLDVNTEGATLHGGKFGFHNQTWTELEYDKNHLLKLQYVSPDGEMGFPGELTVTVTYTLSEENTIGIYYEATTTAPTPVNLCNHINWCLSGDSDHPITEEPLFISSNEMTPVDKNLIPTGKIAKIPDGDAYDFCNFDLNHDIQPRLIGDPTKSNNQQLKEAGGYDCNYVIMDKSEFQKKGSHYNGQFQITDDGSLDLSGDARYVCQAISKETGICMDVVSSEPGLQFFDTHNLNDSMTGKGSEFNKFSAFVLEPQHFPDSPNHPNFPNTILRPGETFRSKTEYIFSVLKN